MNFFLSLPIGVMAFYFFMHEATFLSSEAFIFRGRISHKSRKKRTMAKYISLLLAALCSLAGFDARSSEAADSLTGKYLFLHLPGDALQLIPESTRVDMVDYYEAGQKYRPLNALRGYCSLDSLTSSYASVTVSGASDVQMCVLPCGKKNVAAVVYTVDGGDSPDSQLSFYDASLRELPLKKYFKEPGLESFMVKSKEARAMQQLVPFLLVSYELEPSSAGATLTARLNVKGSMTEEDYARIKPFIATESLTYTWDGHKFSLPRK